jgi:putative CocE/NonD family hydrolase
MTTRDGYTLVADAYVPARDGVAVQGEFPAILDRTPYDKNIRAHLVNDPEYIVKRGYVFVFQDTRGHGGSEGEFSLFGVGHDGVDGHDAVEWIAEQPWSDGDVATCGWSADCISQLILGIERPPHLEAMFLGHGPSNYYQEKFVKVFEDVPPIERWVSGWLDNRTYTDFWKQPGFNSEEHLADYPDIPMFIMGAWYDFFLRGTIRNFVGLK